MVGLPVLQRGEAGIAGEARVGDAAAKRLPEIGGDADDDPGAVAAAERAVGHGAGAAAPGRGHVELDCRAEGLRHAVGVERELAVEQRDLDLLAAAGAGALAQRRQHADHGVEGAGDVADRYAPAAGHGAGLAGAGDAHRSAERLHGDIVGADLGPRAGRAEAADRAADDGRVEPAQRGIVDAEAGEHAGAEIVVDHVGARDEAQEGGLALGALQVERHARLVALERIVETVLVADRRFGRGRPALLRAGRVDADHLGAERGEDLGAERAGDHGREIEHADAGERSGLVCGHSRLPCMAGGGSFAAPARETIRRRWPAAAREGRPRAPAPRRRAAPRRPRRAGRRAAATAAGRRRRSRRTSPAPDGRSG